VKRSVIQVADHVKPDADIVETARQVGDLVVASLQRGETVAVSLRGVRGVPSSFLNVLLSVVAAELPGLDGERFSMEFDSDIQRELFSRSRDAVLKSRQRAG